MADLSYTVEVKGVQDLDRLENTIEKLHSTLTAGKGSGKSLEELRKILIGLKGSGSVLQSLQQSVQSLDRATEGMKNSFKESIGGLSQIIKSEMAQVRATIQTSGIAAGRELGEGLAKGIDESSDKAVKSVRTAAAKARAEMTKAYDNLVGGNGFAQLSTGQLGEVQMLKDAGATVSKYHSQMLKNYEGHLNKQRLVDRDFEAALVAHNNKIKAGHDKAYADQVAALNARIQLSRQENARVTAEMAVARAAEKELAAIRSRQAFQNYGASMGIGAAPKSAKASFSVFADAGLLPGAEKATREAGALSNAMKTLTLNGNDVHSMARGLASGFNLLWLTWGNLAPLFAGAVISNGFVQTAKSGMEVAHTFGIIKNIGGNTTEEMIALNEELTRLGTSGPRGPKEIAEAMQILSLAGLKANEILTATQEVLNFSVAGTTSLQTAADTLVSVATAFNMGAQGFGRVSDVVSKAAAESKTSVESFANAMKTASVINAQYGVSLEDTATAIATMSQLGIEGTAAGTALRNMYADLSGRSIKVAKILREQGIEMRTTTGEFRPMIEVVAELSDHFATLDGISQKNLMQALLSERGAKGLIEMLRLVNSEAKDSSKGFSNALAEVRNNVEDSYGFAAISAAKMAQTTKSQFEAMKATMQTSMFEAYQAMEPALQLIAKELKEAFASKEFREGLTTTVVALADFGRGMVDLSAFVIKHSEVLLYTVGTYAAVRTALNLAEVATKAKTAAVAADTAAVLANNAAQAGGLASLGAVARFLPGVGTAITVAAGAWAVYSMFVRDSGDAQLEAAKNYNDNVVSTLDDQTKRLKELNDLRATGISLTEAQARLDAQKKATEQVDPFSKAVNQAIKEEMDQRRKLSELEQEYANHSARDTKNRIKEQEARVASSARATAAAKRQEQSAIEETRKAAERHAAERKRAAELDDADMKARAEAAKRFGEGVYQQGDDSKRGRPASMNYYDSDFELFKKRAEAEAKIVDTLYSQGKVSAGDYYDWVEYRAERSYNESRKALQSRISELSKDPKSEKDVKKSRVELDVLDLQREAEILKIQNDRAVAMREQLTVAQKMAAFGDTYLKNLKDNDAGVLSLERGGNYVEQEQARIKVIKDFDAKRLEAERSFIDDKAKLDEAGRAERKRRYEEELATLADYESRAVAEVVASEARKKAARENASNGVVRSIEDFQYKAKDSASLVESAMNNTFASMEQGIINFAKTGEFSFKAFAGTIVDEMIKIAAKQAMLGLTNLFGGGLGNLFSGFTSALGGLFSFNAKGNVYDSPSLSAYSNQVHDTPKVFAFAKGAGVFGEAGPEAIMPLTRGADGNLGVRAVGGSTGGGDTFIYVTTNVDSSGANTTTSVTGSGDATQTTNLMKELNNKVKEVIAKETKQGGLIWRAANGY